MLTTHEGAIQGATLPTLNFLWLEITGRCNLQCSHCYAESAPQRTHGMMHTGDWERIITDAHGLGCRSVQFIGGEPTLHPDLPQLMRLATGMGMQVEIYTNLVRIKPALWDVFQECQVRIATSFYSLHPDVHETITQGARSFQRTVANINQVLHLDLPLRVGLIEMRPDQDISATEHFLRDLGVQRIGIDQVRSVGRGRTFVQVQRPEDALCGACAREKPRLFPAGKSTPVCFRAGCQLEMSCTILWERFWQRNQWSGRGSSWRTISSSAIATQMFAHQTIVSPSASHTTAHQTFRQGAIQRNRSACLTTCPVIPKSFRLARQTPVTLTLAARTSCQSKSHFFLLSIWHPFYTVE